MGAILHRYTTDTP